MSEASKTRMGLSLRTQPRLIDSPGGEIEVWSEPFDPPAVWHFDE